LDRSIVIVKQYTVRFHLQHDLQIKQKIK
jgi:hypothetical protein